MAKQSGIGTNFYFNGIDVSGGTQVINKISGGPAVLDVTDITQRAHSRIGGTRDGGIDITALLDPAAGAIHETLSALTTSDAHLMVAIPTDPTAGLAIGDPAVAATNRQVGYDPTRATDGGLTFSIATVSDGHGIEWGDLITPGKRTDTSATDGDSLDMTTASTGFGWTAYAQVFSVTGTSVTLTIEDSADDASFDPLTGGAFTAVADPGPGYQRLAGGATATVRRYVRVASSGTFSEAIFSVMFVRNLVATS
jgi:hypothetical protein